MFLVDEVDVRAVQPVDTRMAWRQAQLEAWMQEEQARQMDDHPRQEPSWLARLRSLLAGRASRAQQLAGDCA